VQKDDGRPDCLEVEITESLLMQDIQSSIRKLSLLRDLDIHIAMDDFGTGYSSLSYLARLPISSVKIDRSFVSAMHTSPQDMSIVATIVALTRSLSIKVVAEGVETPEQHAALKDMGCNEAQGYLFSRPVPANEIAVLLRNDAVDCTLRNVGAGSR
jgi:EAL domain-containing protein (putative c-di-GMP-specific phosphodiesterase class I)